MESRINPQHKQMIRMEVYYCVSDYQNHVCFTAKGAQDWVRKYADEHATYRVAILEYMG